MDKKLPSASIFTYYKFQKKTQRLLLLIALCAGVLVQAQGPGNPFVDAGPDQTLDCASGGCTDIEATFLDIGETTTYEINSIPYNPPFPFTGLANPVSVNQDDIFSAAFDLSFDFCYFDNIFDQAIVGSNGVLSFDVFNAGGFCDFGIGATETIPTTAFHQNSIMTYHDIDPRFGNPEIGYEVIGTAPNRVLAVSFFEVPYYNAGGPSTVLSTFQMVIYETTNVIDFYVEQKPDPNATLGSPINGGRAVLGIQNDNGTEGFAAPGRNTGVWEATQEAWRFSPAGDSVIEFSWLDATGAVIGTTPILNVCPTDPVTTYTAQVIYRNCNGDEVTVTDDVEVTLDGVSDLTLDLGEDLTFCDQSSYEIVPNITGDPTGATYLWSPNGETTPTITVTTTDTYGLEITQDGCTVSDEVEITFLTSPNCEITALCDTLDFNEDFGAGTGRICIDPAEATTTYICNTTTMVNDGEYSITNTSNGLNTGWHPNMEDHTGDLNGRAFFVNADFTIGEFYRRTITLEPTTDYSFGAWITTVYDTDTGICGGSSIPSNVIFRIEDPAGVMIAETNTGDIPNGPDVNWQEYFIDFNTGANTDIQLVLINNSIGGCGNDLAIDDITLEFTSGTPMLVTPPDLELCDIDNDGTEIFDLTAQIPTILDGANPAELNVTFHNSEFNAQADQLAIIDPANYSNVANPETVFVRVERISQETCFAIVDFDLLLNPVVDLTTTLPTEVNICDTEPIPTLDATATNTGIDLTMVTYEWTDDSGTVVSTDPMFTPTVSGTYTVVLTFPPCSESTFVVEVDITASATLDLGPDQLLCDGETFEIVPDIMGNTNGITYDWSTGETTPTIIVDETGTYSLTITVGNCTATDSVMVVILDPLDITLGDDFETCFDDTTQITVTSTGFDIETAAIQWFLNGVEIVGETMPTLSISEVGTYSVTVTFEGCSATDEVVVTEREDVVVAIVEEDFKTCPDETNTLTAVTDEENATYQWFKNGDVITGETDATLEFTLTSDETGLQTFSVVISVGGCTAEDDTSVQLYDIGNCTISQGISPNNDGFNDRLDLEFLNDRTGIIQLQIFNRLGTLVFDKTNYINEWEGQTTDSEELPTGTYYYVLDLQGEDPVFGSQASGWIYLNREAN